MSCARIAATLASLVLAMSACSGSRSVEARNAAEDHTPARMFFIGQDLSALRGYFSSGCCLEPDGSTAYLSLYRLLREPDFGGMGVDSRGAVLSPEASWGAGPVGARQTADEFPPKNIAIGLYIGEEEPDGLSRIIRGEFDSEINALAEFISSVRGDAYLRIGYEFDGAWNAGYENTDNFINAWRHIADQIRNAGVINVQFVWQGSSSPIDDLIDGKREDVRDWYPGDRYVDWVGISWFLPPDFIGPAMPSDAATQRILADELFDFARTINKPVFVAESAPQGYDINEGFRANISPLLDGPASENRVSMDPEELWESWYAPYFAMLNENADIVHAAAYINVDWDNQAMWGPPYNGGFWGDTRLETSPYIAKRFNAEMDSWKSLAPSHFD